MLTAEQQIAELRQARREWAEALRLADDHWRRSERYRHRLMCARLRLAEYREAERRRTER